MKKIVKKGIALFLVIVLALIPGCSREDKKNKNKKAMGRYVEQDIGYPNGEEVGYLFQKDDGTVECYAYVEDAGEWRSYKLNDKGKWEENINAVKIKLSNENELICQVFESEGKVNVVYVTVNNEIALGELQDNGEMNSIVFKENNRPIMFKEFYWPTCKKTEEGHILLTKEWNGIVGRYDGKTGEFINEYHNNCMSFEVIGNKLYETSQDNKINIYEIDNGNLAGTIENVNTGEASIFRGKEEGELYIANSEGIAHLAAGGSIWEQIVSASRTSFNSANLYPYSVFIDKDTFVVQFMGPKSTIKRYYYSDKVATSTNNELSVYMLYNNDIVREAINIYEKQHEDVSVKVQVADQDLSYEDVIKSLTADLLAGVGPDLIVLDDLPIGTYIENEALLDLSDIVKEPIASGQWYENIAGAFRKDDKYYALPMRFTVPMLLGKEEIVNNITTLEGLVAYKESHPNELLLDKTKPELFAELIDFCCPSWFNEDGTINEENIKSFLVSIDRLAIREYSEKDRDKYCFRNELEQEKYKEVLDIAYNVTNVITANPRSSVEILVFTSMIKQRGEGGIGCLKQAGDIAFNAYGILGINANSENQEAAKDIIKIALGEEVGSILSWSGFPINKNAMKAQQELAKEFRPNPISDNRGRRINSDKTIDELYNKADNYLSSARICINRYRFDAFMRIQDECMAYCEGIISLEEALEEINKVAELQEAK